jgi:hypothetical protein
VASYSTPATQELAAAEDRRQHDRAENAAVMPALEDLGRDRAHDRGQAVGERPLREDHQIEEHRAGRAAQRDRCAEIARFKRKLPSMAIMWNVPLPAMKASRSRAAATGLPITCCSIATAHRTGRSVRSGSCMTGPFSRRIVELVRTPVILADGLGPEECRQRYPRGALVDG